MQTLKTAAIVVLLLTVMYSGYVSLTTPPEPIGDEISELIIEENLGFSTDPPDSMLSGDSFGASMTAGAAANSGVNSDAAPNFENNQPSSLTYPASDTYSPSLGKSGVELNPPVANSESGPSMQLAAPTEGTNHFENSFADVPQIAGGSSGETNSGLTNSSPQLGTGATAASSRFPDPVAASNIVAPASTEGYPSTSGTFDMPDPNQTTTNFDPNRGTAFPGTDTQISAGSPTQNPSTTDASSQTLSLNDSAQPGQIQTNDFAAGQSATNQLGSPTGVNRGLANAILAADQLYKKGQLKEALATLSVFYNTPGINDQQRGEMLNRLDPLAREVIYSRNHTLEQPYEMTSTETLNQVANRYQVPWQLLANINGIEDPVTILPGTKLKVLRGPYRAEVNLTRNELTLFVGELYAGRFPIAVGNDPAPQPGSYTVQDKQQSRTYYNQNGNAIPAGNPDNPYGNMWLDLGGKICIHGSPNTVRPTTKGCISLAGDLAGDLYGILSQGSSVTIRR